MTLFADSVFCFDSVCRLTCLARLMSLWISQSDQMLSASVAAWCLQPATCSCAKLLPVLGGICLTLFQTSQCSRINAMPQCLQQSVCLSVQVRNARLGMLAVLGFAVQAWVTGKGPIQNAIDHLKDPWGQNGKVPMICML